MNHYYKKVLELPDRCQFFAAVMINNRDLIPKVEKFIEQKFSKIEMRSQVFSFTHSKYYNREMGDNLYKYFISCEKLIDKEELPDIKISTMKIEDEFLFFKDGYKCRSANIDPGYLTHSKVILSTSKNYSHRIYIGKGVFAELTYVISHEGWKTLDWTYPDYRDKDSINFFLTLRTKYLENKRELKQK